MKRLVIGALGALALAVGSAPLAAGAPNPSEKGQPGVECGDPGATSEPHGFGTPGFENAESHYAGNGKSADQPSSTHAVSQYDVACFQFTSSGH